jgi:hypothetical protein
MKERNLRPSLRGKSAKKKRTNRRKKTAILPQTADAFFAQPEEFQTDWEDMLRVIKRMRTEGVSLRKAASAEEVNPRTVTRLGGRALRKRSNRSYSVTRRDSLLRVMLMPTSHGLQEIAIRNSGQASLLGKYSAAVQQFTRTGDSTEIKQFRNKRIKDVNGVEFPLITDLNELRRLGSAGVLSFESLYGRAA